MLAQIAYEDPADDREPRDVTVAELRGDLPRRLRKEELMYTRQETTRCTSPGEWATASPKPAWRPRARLQEALDRDPKGPWRRVR